jgi:3D (Asp-Asp-Asp) domain-containing protein
VMSKIHAIHLAFGRSSRCGTVGIRKICATWTADCLCNLETERAGRSGKGRGQPFAAILAALLAVGSICASASSTAWAQPPVHQRILVLHAEVGVASWYGHPYHGRRAAGGQIYDMNQLTAAHRTLPFGTRVRVQNLENDASVEVVINDRGPYIEGRTIDLSFAAARALKLDKVGVARVRLELLSAPIPLAVIE